MNNKLANELTEIAHKLNVNIDKLGGMLAAQAKFEFACDIFWIITTLSVIVATAWAVKKSLKHEWDDPETAHLLTVLVSALALLVAIPTVIICSIDALNYICNPSYYTLCQIHRLVN